MTLCFESLNVIKKGNDALSIKALLIKLTNHDHHSFHELYNRFSVQLYANILRMVRDQDLAQEILQDVFVKVWEKRELIDPEKPFNAYLFRIAKNTVYDHFRKIAMEKKLEIHMLSNGTETYSHIEEELIYKESSQLFLNAIDKLSPQRKQVFTLCKLEGKSYHEVSNLLSISTSTVSDHLLKSNKFIRAQLLISDPVVFVLIGYVFNIMNF
ncbi:RNA polymerase sigma-70 factor (ECF subfamily) [Pedobacter sp. AK017]|uniref:RNA polymerase sigma factor n=1 Tax=Pedobacter sp. AK017 TaxID=2723073 RepID=UPI001614BABB|nr:RNA polymerase sigma-70 factor [Pedobacter sp. AK017]MBB5438319.1 RNA polymerase sigma-70 factor (ECF subfamily) [Pedobacter sp. AK017]